MCGKFTAKLSWTELVDFAHTPAGNGENDRSITYRVMGILPVILLDQETGARRVVPMRWGFPHSRDWQCPQPIHARSETIESVQAFSQAFQDGQRGIVLMKTFNEAPDLKGRAIQYNVTPGDEKMLAAAFVWRRFQVPGNGTPLFACVLATVPANKLIATLPTDRMPPFSRRRIGRHGLAKNAQAWTKLKLA